MKTRFLLSMVAGVGLACGAAAAQDVGAGEELYQGVCTSCHGRTAGGMASFPKLTGNSEEYLISRLETYRAGEQVGPNSALMIPHASDLSDDEIANLAAYITSLE